MRTAVTISVLATFTLCVLDLALAYPEYVPEEACASMRPGHTENKTYGGTLIEPMWSEHYFYIEVSKTYDVYAGEAIEVTLWTKDYDYDTRYFEGFLIQAHTPGSNIWDPANPPKRHGEFYSYMDDTQLACGTEAISHSTHKHYEMAKFYWMAPYVDYDEEFQFVATVVKGYSTFYMDIRSDSVWVMGQSSTSVTDSAPAGPATASMVVTLFIAMATALFR